MPTMLEIPEVRMEVAGRWAAAETGLAQAVQVDQQAIRGLLAAFEPISMAQMDGAALLERSELKFLMPQNLLAPVLADQSDPYRVLVVNGQRLSRYRPSRALCAGRCHFGEGPD